MSINKIEIKSASLPPPFLRYLKLHMSMLGHDAFQCRQNLVCPVLAKSLPFIIMCRITNVRQIIPTLSEYKMIVRQKQLD